MNDGGRGLGVYEGSIEILPTDLEAARSVSFMPAMMFLLI
jgi:hypothetical protein